MQFLEKGSNNEQETANRFNCGRSSICFCLFFKCFGKHRFKRLGTSLNLSDSESSLPLTPYIGVVSVEGTIMDSNSTTSFLSNGYNHKETLKLIEDMKIQQATKAFFCM